MFFSQICDVAYAAVTADKIANNNRSMLVRTDDRGAIAIAGGTAGDKNSTAKEQGNGSIAIGLGVKTLVTASKGVAIGSDAQVLANSGLSPLLKAGIKSIFK